MKTLGLLRHGKSDWSDPSLEDFERPLAPRGTKAAPRMGKAMKALGLVPDLVLCSAARRTRETWDLVAPRLGGTPRVSLSRGLYLAGPPALLKAIREVGPEVETLLMIGHNPGLENLAALLAGPDSEPRLLTKMGKKFPTGALAVLAFEIDTWREAAPGAGRLIRFVRPRDLD